MVYGETHELLLRLSKEEYLAFMKLMAFCQNYKNLVTKSSVSTPEPINAYLTNMDAHKLSAVADHILKHGKA